MSLLEFPMPKKEQNCMGLKVNFINNKLESDAGWHLTKNLVNSYNIPWIFLLFDVERMFIIEFNVNSQYLLNLKHNVE